MQMSKLAPDAEGYLTDPETGKRVIFWPCDPAKNVLCTKAMCRGCTGLESEAEIGFCASTPERAFAKEGSKPFYKRLNAEGYFGREYIEEGGGGNDQG